MADSGGLGGLGGGLGGLLADFLADLADWLADSADLADSGGLGGLALAQVFAPTKVNPPLAWAYLWTLWASASLSNLVEHHGQLIDDRVTTVQFSSVQFSSVQFSFFCHMDS